jgi:hypothetical protein
MDLPSHLKSLPPGALEVILYLSQAEDLTASREEICDDVGLSERGFGKVIRRLVTKSYVIMDGDQLYRLTDQGGDIAEELADYDLDADSGDDDDDAEQFTRRMRLVLPEPLQAGVPAHVMLGFDAPEPDSNSAEVAARLSILNGEPDAPQEALFDLDDQAAHQDFLVTPGAFTQARLRIEVYQLGPNEGDISVAGGMYVDVAVSVDSAGELRAYGTDIDFAAFD